MPKKIATFSTKDTEYYFQQCIKGDYAGDLIAPIIKNLSSKYIKGKVLDVGAGSGALIDLIPNAIGLDLSPKHPGIIKGNIVNLPFENESFDTIFATEILEHLDDQTLKKGLSEIYRVLKKEGYFIITTPYKENLEQSMVVCPKCHTRFHRIGHVSSFDETKIKKIFIKNNLTIVKLRILPLGSFARHPFLKYFWKIFNKLQLGFKPSNLFVIAKK